VSLVECKDATATVLFMTVATATLGMLLVTTLVLWLLEIVLALVDLCCKDPNFFFRGEEATLPATISFLQIGG